MRNRELEEVIRQAPHDLDGYEVYADWLIEHGEQPHGELILFAIRRRREGPTTDLNVITAEARLLRERERIFGALGRMPRDRVECDLELGFLDAIRIYAKGDDAAAALRHAFTHRTGAFLRDVAIQSKNRNDAPPVNEDRATTLKVWELIFELGLPRTLEAIATPLLLDNVPAQCEALAHIPRCTFPIRNCTTIAPHIASLRALKTLSFTAPNRARGIMLDALLNHASAFADVERINLALAPAYDYDLRPLREALPQLELRGHS